jgi:endonuclease YncB( thermonuclease family)
LILLKQVKQLFKKNGLEHLSSNPLIIWRARQESNPRPHQAFESRSKQSLFDLCFGTQAEIISQVKDHHKRTVARVKCSGVDVNKEQVTRGMAWVYPQYAKDQNLYILQDDAKLARRGL